jgi:hypothetical protein
VPCAGRSGGVVEEAARFADLVAGGAEFFQGGDGYAVGEQAVQQALCACFGEPVGLRGFKRGGR